MLLKRFLFIKEPTVIQGLGLKVPKFSSSFGHISVLKTSQY